MVKLADLFDICFLALISDSKMLDDVFIRFLLLFTFLQVPQLLDLDDVNQL